MPKMDRMVGFSKMNIMLFNALSEATGLDATENDEVYYYDKCLTRTDSRRKVMHANTISLCATDEGSTVTKPGNCQGNSCFGDGHVY
jgi:hypothetical protein